MKLQLLKARLQSIKETLRHSSEKEKSGHVSWSLATDYNTIIKDIGDQFPDAKDSLPDELRQERHFRGIAEATFLDLEVKVNQAISIIEVLESGQ